MLHLHPKGPGQTQRTPHIPCCSFRPWQKVSIDIFAWDKKTYLVTVNYYSWFFEVDKLLSTTSTAEIRKLSGPAILLGMESQKL